MVAPEYAAQRSALAKSLGLGRKAEPVPAAVKAKLEGPGATAPLAKRNPKAIAPADET
jgi:hypothetical protein